MCQVPASILPASNPNNDTKRPLKILWLGGGRRWCTLRSIVYITHEEVTGVKPTLADLLEVLKDLQKYNLVVAICRINFLVTIGTTEEILSREQQVCDLVFNTLRENLNRLRKKFERRVVFNRISLLFVLKQALLSAPENGAPLKPN